MNRIAKFFHEMRNPHCLDCQSEQEAHENCKNCDLLRQLLEDERRSNRQLLDRIMNPPVAPVVEHSVEETTEPLGNSKYQPWSIRRKIVEAEDRNKARVLAEKKKELALSNPEQERIDKLAEELGLDDKENEDVVISQR